MALLQNDFALDLKDQKIRDILKKVDGNLELVKKAVEEHVTDTSMHYLVDTKIEQTTNNIFNFGGTGSGSSSTTNYYNIIGGNSINSNALTEDTVIFIPIDWDASTAQKTIDKQPHNLNGFTMVFLFTVPTGFKPTDEKYCMNLFDDYIRFSNFNNGRLIVAGDFIHENKYGFLNGLESRKDSGSEGNFSVAKIVAGFDTMLDTPESVDLIKTYETDAILSASDTYNLAKITIRGTGLNEAFSSIAFVSNNCNAYMMNLSLESAIEDSNNDGKITISDFYGKKLPNANNLLAYWTLENSLEPEIGYNLLNKIKDNHDKDAKSTLSALVSSIDSYLSVLSGRFTTLRDRLESDDGYTILKASNTNAAVIKEELLKNFDSIFDMISNCIRIQRYNNC